MQPIKGIAATIMLFLTPCLVPAADLSGYLLDSDSRPVRSASGQCWRNSSWSAQFPVPGCDVMPDRIVLLPGQDGSAGAVIVRSTRGEMVLDRAYAALEVSQESMVERREDAASVQARYGATLGAMPPRPVSFTVNFATGSSSELTPESYPIIEQMKAALGNRPAPEITVIGHTDRVGGANVNDNLSLKRAETVRDILIRAGVKAKSLEMAGRGEREPIVPTDVGVAEVRNRRVEISIR